MIDSLSLRDASAQDIQLELLRRTQFNTMNGERIVASLLKHRDLWMAVLLDRQGLANHAEPGLLLMSGLIKLRDLPYNVWNADTLFILTRTHEQANRMAQVIAEEEDDWVGGMTHVYDEQAEIDRALGTGRKNNGLLSVWWD